MDDQPADASAFAHRTAAPEPGTPADQPGKLREASVEVWPAREWVLAGLLALAGFVVWALIDTREEEAWRLASAAFVAFGALAAAFTLDRNRWREPAIFAALVGAVMGGLAWRISENSDAAAGEPFIFAAGLLCIGLALPLYQAGFHRHRLSTSYAQTHHYVWTDAIGAAGALAFTGLTWLVLLLIGQLFELLGIDLIVELMQRDWFVWTLSGAAFGAALGRLRGESTVLGTLQGVVLLLLSLLAVPVAVALVLFLAAMVISGPDVLWAATSSATPILLALAAGSFILVNAVIRDADDAMRSSRVVRWAALLLAIFILPLTLFAAISLGVRIAQHGLTPERLWSLVAIGVGVAYGVAYAASWLRARFGPFSDWRAGIRQTNLILAAATCTLAFLLSLPLIDFGAIAARQQVARLQGGEVTPGEFDFTALRWDFGDSGREALQFLANSRASSVANSAKEALAQDVEPARVFGGGIRQQGEIIIAGVEDPASQDRVRRQIRGQLRYHCETKCRVQAVGPWPGGGTHLVLVSTFGVTHLVVGPGDRFLMPGIGNGYLTGDPARPPEAAEPENAVELRPYAGRQIYQDGRPFGEPFAYPPKDALEAGRAGR
ncbi:DUF4153 domain-containing protein [Altererythrobacter sp. SALINAS58]|uniref:DUF4153 domain-containing protein n=1 Tax=Alteripontixanthobacter muriae TaxID=2705546 RepID=UPI001576C141|nr:DUF4153 domain-containing protein [Alteripontixanthobacter muriae]NTZ42268.1 DUF4153 domain-containing protein [Alteripontixanthobacter muriae]